MYHNIKSYRFIQFVYIDVIHEKKFPASKRNGASVTHF